MTTATKKKTAKKTSKKTGGGSGGFAAAIGRVVLVRSSLYGRRSHDAICEGMLDAETGDRAKVKLPGFEPEARPARILRIHPSDGGPTVVDVTVDTDPERDANGSHFEILREQVLHDEEPKKGDVVVFVPPRV